MAGSPHRDVCIPSPHRNRLGLCVAGERAAVALSARACRNFGDVHLSQPSLLPDTHTLCLLHPGPAPLEIRRRECSLRGWRSEGREEALPGFGPPGPFSCPEPPSDNPYCTVHQAPYLTKAQSFPPQTYCNEGWIIFCGVLPWVL